MKKILSILLIIIILLLPLSGCLKSPSEQEQTNEEPQTLTVLIPGWTIAAPAVLEWMFEEASVIFYEEYGIEVVRYPTISYEEYYAGTGDTYEILGGPYRERLYAEVMGGKGPDIYLSCFIGYMDMFEDIYKVMDSGAFYDMNEFIANDPNFDISIYEQNILDAGIYKEQRYIMPLSYIVPLLLTSKEKMNSIGLTADDFSTFERFLSSWEDMQQNNSHIRILHNPVGGGNWGEQFVIDGSWLDWCLDYENGTTHFYDPSFERMMNLFWREYQLIEYGPSAGGSTPYVEGVVMEDRLITSLSFVGDLVARPEATTMNQEDMVIFPNVNAYGDVTAHVRDYCMVSSTTQNPEMAWNFVKILMGEEVQTIVAKRIFGVPVMSRLVDESIDWRFNNDPIVTTNPYDAAFMDKIKGYYHNYDNVVLTGTKSNLIIPQIMEYIESPEEQDFDAFKTKLENYFKIYMSE